ncbi:hypothetical protein SAMN05444920_103604 [Nonomuraea solani]|uniref:Neocarzinostatin family protein n=1 Tax=Nonomuraea solani TaxID=1144553 RepID=A0A1H6BSD1_9ACTN|nr:hypothetical protein [Nonomuraea solani]SEG63542.1 hypothetical protein SAMN05444920_103604 [Nonomuraea solani]
MKALLLLGYLLLTTPAPGSPSATGLFSAMTPAPDPSSVTEAVPAIELDRTAATVGETITVTLGGWPPGNVLVEVCGNERRGGSSDCAISGGVAAVVLDGGTTRVPLPLPAPPVACPCVVAATAVTGVAATTVPLQLSGAPQTAAAQNTGTPKLTIIDTALPEGPSWWWLFGLSGSTPLDITIRNDGTAAAENPPVSLQSGPEGGPGAIITSPAIGTIQPGQQHTFRVEVPLEAPVFGPFEVSGTIQDTVLRTGESVYPFGLLALLVIPLHLTTAWLVFTAPIPSRPARELTTA